MDYYDARETRPPAEREAELFSRLPGRAAQRDGGAGLCRAPAGRRSRRDYKPDGVGGPTGAAQGGPPCPAQGSPAVRRLRRLAFPARSGGCSPRPVRSSSPSRSMPIPGAARAPCSPRDFAAGDVVLNTFSYHLTPGGFIFDSSARALGCAVIPAGPGNTEAQFELIEAYRPIGYSGTPDFLKILLDAAVSAGRDVSSIKRALVSGAAFPKSLQDEVKIARHRCLSIIRHRRSWPDCLRNAGARGHGRQ